MSAEIFGQAHSVALRADLVRALYRQKPTILIASIVNAAIVTLVLWEVSPKPWPGLWLALVIAVALVRVALMSRYHKVPSGDVDPKFWARALVASAAASGILWGAAGVLFFTPGNELYQVFLVFVIGGMCAGAAAALSSYPAAFYAFLVPSVAPLTVRLGLEGELVQAAMGAMLALFGGAMTVLARNLHQTIVGALKDRLEKETLLEERMTYEEHLEREVADRTADLATEISERKRTEADLRGSEARLEGILVAAGDGILSVSERGVIEEANPAAGRMFGYSSEQLCGMSVADLVPPEDRDQLVQMFSEYVTTRTTQVPSLPTSLRHRPPWNYCRAVEVNTNDRRERIDDIARDGRSGPGGRGASRRGPRGRSQPRAANAGPGGRGQAEEAQVHRAVSTADSGGGGELHAARRDGPAASPRGSVQLPSDGMAQGAA